MNMPAKNSIATEVYTTFLQKLGTDPVLGEKVQEYSSRYREAIDNFENGERSGQQRLGSLKPATYQAIQKDIESSIELITKTSLEMKQKNDTLATMKSFNTFLDFNGAVDFQKEFTIIKTFYEQARPEYQKLAGKESGANKLLKNADKGFKTLVDLLNKFQSPLVLANLDKKTLMTIKENFEKIRQMINAVANFNADFSRTNNAMNAYLELLDKGNEDKAVAKATYTKFSPAIADFLDRKRTSSDIEMVQTLAKEYKAKYEEDSRAVKSMTQFPGFITEWSATINNVLKAAVQLQADFAKELKQGLTVESLLKISQENPNILKDLTGQTFVDIFGAEFEFSIKNIDLNKELTVGDLNRIVHAVKNSSSATSLLAKTTQVDLPAELMEMLGKKKAIIFGLPNIFTINTAFKDLIASNNAEKSAEFMTVFKEKTGITLTATDLPKLAANVNKAIPETAQSMPQSQSTATAAKNPGEESASASKAKQTESKSDSPRKPSINLSQAKEKLHNLSESFLKQATKNETLQKAVRTVLAAEQVAKKGVKIAKKRASSVMEAQKNKAELKEIPASIREMLEKIGSFKKIALGSLHTLQQFSNDLMNIKNPLLLREILKLATHTTSIETESLPTLIKLANSIIAQAGKGSLDTLKQRLSITFPKVDAKILDDSVKTIQIESERQKQFAHLVDNYSVQFPKLRGVIVAIFAVLTADPKFQKENAAMIPSLLEKYNNGTIKNLTDFLNKVTKYTGIVISKNDKREIANIERSVVQSLLNEDVGYKQVSIGAKNPKGVLNEQLAKMTSQMQAIIDNQVKFPIAAKKGISFNNQGTKVEMFFKPEDFNMLTKMAQQINTLNNTIGLLAKLEDVEKISQAGEKDAKIITTHKLMQGINQAEKKFSQLLTAVGNSMEYVIGKMERELKTIEKSQKNFLLDVPGQNLSTLSGDKRQTLDSMLLTFSELEGNVKAWQQALDKLVNTGLFKDQPKFVTQQHAFMQLQAKTDSCSKRFIELSDVVYAADKKEAAAINVKRFSDVISEVSNDNISSTPALR